MITFFNNESIQFYLILLTVWITIYIPYIGKYIRLISTMIHEGGHVWMGWMLGEKTVKINLFSNAGGEASVTISNKFKKLLIAIAGYPLTALMAFFSFWLLSKDLHVYYIIGIVSISFLFLLLYFRIFFGIIWAVTFISINVCLLYFHYHLLIHILAQAYACIILLESVFSCFILMYVSFTSNITSDASNIASVLYLPKQFIAILFTAFNVYMAYVTITHFFPTLNHIIN